MGDAKRRKEQGKPDAQRIVSWLPLTTAQSSAFVRVSTQGAWIGIGLLVFGWLMVRAIGPSLGWWKIVG
ncbi:DUF2839 domain-containing protein [Chamaesiphon minutus]|uniref:DUF2839 domain-containing protein n=1 Tax=Chamaesiphon minutus (strain ATCC 27169 / PCC 6605) TaxID=1173020 RepID=K9UMG8_CHAP6|nr:DUF2839 domain-containing protein [Chamaesiphon minutus]AFY96025.1 Protein of unknown function (DUF2839) [Chamaesiphon minutus PCC 6605]